MRQGIKPLLAKHFGRFPSPLTAQSHHQELPLAPHTTRWGMPAVALVLAQQVLHNPGAGLAAAKDRWVSFWPAIRPSPPLRYRTCADWGSALHRGRSGRTPPRCASHCGEDCGLPPWIHCVPLEGTVQRQTPPPPTDFSF